MPALIILLLVLISGIVQAKTDINELLKKRDSIFSGNDNISDKISILNDISTIKM